MVRPVYPLALASWCGLKVSTPRGAGDGVYSVTEARVFTRQGGTLCEAVSSLPTLGCAEGDAGRPHLQLARPQRPKYHTLVLRQLVRLAFVAHGRKKLAHAQF